VTATDAARLHQPTKLPERRIGRTAAQRRRLTLVGFATPAVVLMLIINAYPVVFAATQSLHGGSLISFGPYVGFQNFGQVLSDPTFWQAARFTLIFTACGVFGSWMVGFGLALLLRPRFAGRSVFRVLLLLPWVAPIVVSAMSWNWLTATQDSLLPVIARALGFGQVLFLANPVLATITVCLFKIWVSYPFTMMMASAALEGVDENVYEAASIDGATRWQRFRFITLPLTARSTYITWVLMAMFSVNDFPTIFLLTGGGPVNATTSFIVLAYQSVFRDFLPGYGVAVSFVTTAILVVISLLLFRRIRGSRVE
jgi:multiple sugar transport system permease protein